ncbi:DUF4422 domain-containing protein [Lacticaseibacillus rhamnosus]|uniref:DUF4422 domain-containing protein n=1 Tax=Lacticaseibacillus rhamnosus TaxID=47715 RepID=UPI000629DE71|nr:DUF4422 domain-containing protein [Lacticaseibacillus rhamnosus]KKW88833.1 exopolysaccharide biosynthesis protein [Lacticaseibacillus rhamnosus]PTM25443.1 DUF4422 domain-containing protein [Lacticaseibacillus rhamnosus]
MVIKILVATHKDVALPSGGIYSPVFVGSSLHSEILNKFQPDNEGENISNLNPRFNELTAVYWAWKNDSSEIVGLTHYRRLFRSPGIFNRQLLDGKQVTKALEKTDVILPKKRHYYIETIESHYYHSHSPQGLDILKDVIGLQPAKYRESLNQVLKARSAHMFNMFVMPRELFEQYCQWVFPILFEVDHRIDYSTLSGNETRAVGFVSEILMDVWIQANNLTYTEDPLYFVGSQHWGKKVVRFILNKFLGRKVRLNSHIE